jgi:DNA-directed RNA polymerase specialized sigma24 family protein
MTEPQARHLIAIVRRNLQQDGLGPDAQPEYDDLLGEAILAAYGAVTRGVGGTAFSWKTIAGRAGVWAAREYLRSRRSGRIVDGRVQTDYYRQRWRTHPTAEQETAQAPPLSLDTFPVEVYEASWDGGIAAADARLQLWLLSPALTPGQRVALRLVYAEGRTESEAARCLGITHSSLAERLKNALTKYRRAAGLDAPR